MFSELSGKVKAKSLEAVIRERNSMIDGLKNAKTVNALDLQEGIKTLRAQLQEAQKKYRDLLADRGNWQVTESFKNTAGFTTTKWKRRGPYYKRTDGEVLRPSPVLACGNGCVLGV